MKKCILLFVFFTSSVVVLGQKIDYKLVADRSYKMFNADTKNGLKGLLKNRPLEEVLKNTTAMARGTLDKYNSLLANAHFSGPYTLKEFDIALRKANINIDSWFKASARILADSKQPENKRIAELQIVFGLNKLLNIPLKIASLESREEFINHDIFLQWKNRDMENVSLTGHQLYDAYKLGVRLAQSRGNKQLTDYFSAQGDIDRVNWVAYYLDKAFFKSIIGEIVIKEPVNTPDGQRQFFPGEKEPVYFMMVTLASFPKGYDEFYTVMNAHLQYPAEEWNRGIEGEASVQFVAEKDGSISHARVVGSVTPDIDAEILKALKFLPKLIPGHLKSDRKPIRTFQAYAVNFIIRPGKARSQAFDYKRP
jgi:TonB family protein